MKKLNPNILFFSYMFSVATLATSMALFGGIFFLKTISFLLFICISLNLNKYFIYRKLFFNGSEIFHILGCFLLLTYYYFFIGNDETSILSLIFYFFSIFIVFIPFFFKELSFKLTKKIFKNVYTIEELNENK